MVKTNYNAVAEYNGKCQLIANLQVKSGDPRKDTSNYVNKVTCLQCDLDCAQATVQLLRHNTPISTV